MSDQAAETKIEATFEQKMAFKRAYLEAMRNMATIAAYAFATAYITHRQIKDPFDKTVMVVAGFCLSWITIVGAGFAMDFFWLAMQERFPHFRHRLVWRLFGAIIVTVIALAPAYLTFFRGD